MNNYDYKRLPPFKWYVLENFPFIEADFDALTNWQLFCKLGKEMNLIIKSLNDMGIEVEYLSDFYNNLDLQEEVNQKLDEMAQSGELTEIIAEYLNLKSVLGFNTVSEMLEGENLVDGSFAKTYGFYNLNDGGGALYKIREVTNADTVNDFDLLAMEDENLVAELIKEYPINVLKLGAKNDGTTDTTEALDYILTQYHDIYFPDGTYLIDAEDSLKPISNSKIILSNNAVIKAKTTDAGSYVILKIDNKENVIVSGGTIEGERSTHTGATGEYGMCISVLGSENITLKNITLKDAWGDGLYINDVINLNTENLYIDNCRRNGISVIKANGYHSQNDKIENINGTLPESGIDFEPNTSADSLKNIIIENMTTKNCDGYGLSISLLNLTNDSDEVDLNIFNYHDNTSKYGCRLRKSENTKGKILIDNCLLENNEKHGIRMTDAYDSDLKIIINRPRILNCNTDDDEDSNVAGISMSISNTDTKSIGNILINEAYITSHYSGSRYIVSRGNSTVNNKNITIINPLNNDSAKQLTISNTENFIFKDLYEKFIVNPVGGTSSNISGGNYKSKALCQNVSADYTYSLVDTLPIGAEIEFINLMASNSLSIEFANTEYIKKYSPNAGYTLELENYNDKIKLKKINSTDWIEI